MSRFAVRLAASYLLILLLTVGGLGVTLSAEQTAAYEAELHSRLLVAARAAAVPAAPLLAARTPLSSTQALAQQLGAALDAQVTLIDSAGEVRGDSEDDPLLLDNQLSRPEVRAALSGPSVLGESTRFSATLHRDLYYVAVPLLDPPEPPQQIVGVARVALPAQALDAAREALWRDLLTTALIISVLAGGLAWLLTRTLSEPVGELRRVTERIGLGDLQARSHVTSSPDLGDLGREINLMAERLADVVRRRTGERNEMAAVLAHMHDGIIITDADGTISGINPAAARLLGTTSEAALGRSLIQVAHDHELYAALRASLVGPGAAQRLEVALGGYQLAATLTAVPATAARSLTGLVVLQDVTELRYLERVRRDFVANISHELRTPLATVKLLAETLETAVSDDPDAAVLFVHNIQVELDDMTQLVQELLELSRIESGQVALKFQSTPLAPLLQESAARLGQMAERKAITLQVRPPDPALPPVRADAGRIEQVLRNLIHNAIKFTPPTGLVVVQATAHLDGVAICVQDTGIGIAPEDLPRVFERFYKVDKARAAGDTGGTGLGLAIAKHLVRAHGGQIWATSTLGGGSTFCFSLPPVQPHKEL